MRLKIIRKDKIDIHNVQYLLLLFITKKKNYTRYYLYF